ncbi:MAG: fimbrillin family protein, partial [Bacteroidales bacterium]
WNAASGITPVYLTKSSVELCSYYPYSSALSGGIATLTSQLYSAEKDFCYQRGVSGSSNSSVSFELGHAYSQITFMFTHKGSYSGTCKVSNISISNSGILVSNTLDITTGSASTNTGTYGSGTAGTVSVAPAIASIAYEGNASAAVLMVPTVSALSGTIDLSFTIDGTVFTASVDASGTGITSLEAGKNYTVNVNIGNETANCYIVPSGSSKIISVGIRGNGGATASTGLDVAITPASVGVVWETTSGLITLSDFNSSKKTVKITSSGSGNAVIAAYSGEGQTGTILWSWHIWVTDYDPDTITNGTTYAVTNGAGYVYTFMDRNLGAVSNTSGDAGTIGLQYQWGRKDPFTASPLFNSQTETSVYDGSGNSFTFLSKEETVSTDNNLENTIKNPTIFYKGINNSSTGFDWYTSTNSTSSQNGALWGGSSISASSDKTIFDPCPAGWRVPAWEEGSSPWSALGSDGTATSSVGTWGNYGVTWTAITAGYWPAAGYRYCINGALYYAGLNGFYWSASPYSNHGYFLNFSSSSVYPSNNNYRAYGFSVRCVKE